MKLFALVLVLVAACAAPRAPETPSRPAGAGTLFGAVCDHLRTVGCPEAEPNRRGTSCFQVMTNAAVIADVPSTCLLQAWSVDDVRACGDEHTVRVRCVKK